MNDPVPTTCMRCAVGCGHLTGRVDSGYGIDGVRGDVAHPTNRGLACSRGIDETQNPDGEWLTRPHVRQEGELRRTTWDVALSRIVDEFSDALDRNRDGLAVLGSGQQTNEAAYALGKLARGGFGTRHYDANTTLCMASAVTAYNDAFGSDAPPPTYDDVEDATTHVVWGANPAVAHPVLFRWIVESATDGESRLIVVDPVETKTAKAGDRHVAPEPGTDLALARAVLARVIERGEVDEAFVEEATTGFGALRAELPDPESAAATAGVSLATVEALVDALRDPTLVYWGMGVNQSAQGTDTAGALIDLCLATGNMGPGSGPFSLTGQANSMGTRVCSSKGSWPGMRSFEDPAERRTIAEAWGVPVERLPDDPGPGPVGICEAIGDGPVEALWAVATNPAAGLPDASAARERLRETFLVVQDAFHTDTTELADVVLPAATWGESDGTAMNMERRISRVRPASDLAPAVRTDLDIITSIGEALVPGLFPATEPEAVFDEFAALTAGTDADCSGVSYDRLREERAVRWPAPSAKSAGGYRYHDDGDWSFRTPSGRARFSTGTHAGVPEPTDESYPLTLTTGRESDGYNTGIRSRDGDAASAVVARVNPDTVERLNGEAESAGEASPADEGEAGEAETGEKAAIAADETACLTSRRGSIPVRVTVDTAVPAGTVWLPIHRGATNELTLPVTDPRSDEPNYKQCAVALEPTTDGVAAEEQARTKPTADD
ncbi:assimilatory nitrate reductase catalytic subunit [Halorubrum trapanicum]|uniref:Assimilatory nitrate reductase catalytic subunit n=1 Tax=Halorubrum trapanicum TaxID=29284 RepID=A0A8J7RSR7_9EURY|nr:assimilatory nitrate reductase NasA [Halorubrum trapanicum]MBP1901192.1 assimilatory nitrate reductase catalytic subunit [Halorubrum trapanicum]